MKTKLTFFLFLSCLLSLGIPGNAQQTTDPNAVITDALGKQLDQYLSRLAAFGFSGTVLVAKDKQVLLHKGYGLADAKTGVQNTTRTVFDIASITKQFTATAILKLESVGKLKTSDAISKYLPGVPPDKKAVTLHHLLTHSSGLPFECPNSDKMSREQFIQCMLAAKLNAEPGKQYEYSNAGFGLLAAIVEIVAAQSYESYVQEQLFKPAGMTATAFNGSGIWSNEVLAHGYDETLERGTPQMQPPNWQKRGAWGLSTTAGDLYQWEKALRDNKILSAASTKKLFTFHVPTNADNAGYGYGWAIRKTKRGTKLVEHDGVTFDGFSSIFQRYVDENVVVIITSNKFFSRFLPITLVAPAIAGVVFNTGSTLPPASCGLTQEQLKKYAGTYRLPSGAKLFVRVEGEGLQIGAEGQDAINVLAPTDEKTSAAFHQLNDRTRKIIAGIQQREYAPIIQAFAKEMNAEQAKQTATGWLNRLEAQNGALKTIEIVGTMQELDVMRTFVRLGFERGEQIRRFRWENGSLGTIIIGQLPLLTTTFLPQSTTDFTGLHLGIAKLIPIRFHFNEQNDVTEMTVLLQGTNAIALKEK